MGENEIESSEYKAIKAEYEKKIERLNCTIFELSWQSENIDDLLKRTVQSLSQMGQLYENSDNEVKRQIIGSIFPEKMVFDGQSYRTTRVNEAVRLIWAMGAGSAKIEMDKPTKKSICPFWLRKLDIFRTAWCMI